MSDPRTLERQRNSGMSGILLGVTELPALPESVASAREFVRVRLGADHPVLGDVVLLTSEAFTNSVKYSDSRNGGSVMVALADCLTSIHVDVVDAGGDSFPHLRGDFLSEGGRGLVLVESLSDRWGVYEDDAGRTTWFEVKYDSHEMYQAADEQGGEKAEDAALSTVRVRHGCIHSNSNSDDE